MGTPTEPDFFFMLITATDVQGQNVGSALAIFVKILRLSANGYQFPLKAKEPL